MAAARGSNPTSLPARDPREEAIMLKLKKLVTRRSKVNFVFN